MPAKTSKEVTDRQKSCRFLLTALRQQGAWVAEQLLELVRPHLPAGDEEPDFHSPIVALARLLEASIASLVAADEGVYAANAHLGRLRQRRDELFALLARKIARLRLTLINQFVAPRLDDLGFEQETARSPTPLLRQADRIEAAFEGDGLRPRPRPPAPGDGAPAPGRRSAPDPEADRRDPAAARRGEGR